MQVQLVEILRNKGIGPKGSKQLTSKNIEDTPELLYSPFCNLTTKATLLCALQLLDKSKEEQTLISLLKNNVEKIPNELHFLISLEGITYEEKLIIHLIKTNDLTEEEAKQSSDIFLSVKTAPYLLACYLEALRLKRETDLENKIFYQYFLKECKRVKVNCPPIIEIGDSYDGMNRNFNFNLLTACTLAALGYRVLLTGNETVAPKKGVTHHQILKSLSKNPFLTIEEAAEQLVSIGVTYLDQSQFHPELWQKKEMREAMVKRPFLATFEKILSPIYSSEGNYVATSYTHAHYKNANIEIFKSSKYINKALNIKGLEGTIHPKSNVSTPVISLNATNETKESNYKFVGEIENPALEITLENHAHLFREFLEKDNKNYVYYYVVNTVILLLQNFELAYDSLTISTKIEALIKDKSILKIWEKLK